VTYNVLQSASGSGGTNTQTASLATNLSSGSKLVAYLMVAASAVASTVKDTAGNSFGQVFATSFTGPPGTDNFYIYVLDTPAGDVGATTVITATTTGSAGGMALLVQEVSGLAAGSTAGAVLDGTAGTLTGNTSGAFSTGTPTYSSGTAGEYLVAVYGDDGDTSGTTVTTPPSGYTADTHNIHSSGNSDLAVYYEPSTGGAETDGFTIGPGSSGVGWLDVVVAFKLAAGAAAAPGGARSAQPGRAWLRQFHHRQIALQPASAAAVLNVTAEVPTGAGAAPAPIVAEGVNATAAQATAIAPQPVPAITVFAAVATAAGVAPQPTVSTVPATSAPAGVATAAGVALPSTVAITANAAVATAAGVAPPPAAETARLVFAGVATAAGVALQPSLALATLAHATAAQALAVALAPTVAAQSAFTVGALTASTVPGAALSASDAPGGTSGGRLTASDTRTGGPGG
jgi:hypothetical protein